MDRDESREAHILHQRLLAPFDRTEVEVRPGDISGNTALPLYFVDARVVARRLDRVLGPGSWNVRVRDVVAQADRYEKVKKDGTKDVREGLHIVCVLEMEVRHPLLTCTVSNLGERGLDEPLFNKATNAYAQAFKRTAAMIGAGAYLYECRAPRVPLGKNYRMDGYVLDDEVVETALQRSGFLFQCEETGSRIPWEVAARSLGRFGRILCVDEIKKRLEADS